MLCSPMRIPPHRSRQLDPPLSQSRMVRICQNRVGRYGKSTFGKNVTPQPRFYAGWGAKPFKHLLVVPSSLVPKILLPPLARISIKRVRF